MQSSFLFAIRGYSILLLSVKLSCVQVTQSIRKGSFWQFLIQSGKGISVLS
jgi:hypothetical protein